MIRVSAGQGPGEGEEGHPCQAAGGLGAGHRLLVGGAIGGWANCNGWNGIDGMVPNTSNTWKQRV